MVNGCQQQQHQPATQKMVHQVEERYHHCSGTLQETNRLSVVGAGRLCHKLRVDGVAGARFKYSVQPASFQDEIVIQQVMLEAKLNDTIQNQKTHTKGYLTLMSLSFVMSKKNSYIMCLSPYEGCAST